MGLSFNIARLIAPSSSSAFIRSFVSCKSPLAAPAWSAFSRTVGGTNKLVWDFNFVSFEVFLQGITQKLGPRRIFSGILYQARQFIRSPKPDKRLSFASLVCHARCLFNTQQKKIKKSP
jgi:hypothetical protein